VSRAWGFHRRNRCRFKVNRKWKGIRMAETADAVTYEMLDEGKVEICFGDALLTDQVMDYTNAPEGASGGQMRKLLCSAALGCYAGSVKGALIARGVEIRSLGGTASATAGRNVGNQTRVEAIGIRVEVGIDDNDAETLEKVSKILENGCLITRSLEPGIKVTHTIVRV
jgi:uncharacterized OsmC-like protein